MFENAVFALYSRKQLLWCTNTKRLRIGGKQVNKTIYSSSDWSVVIQSMGQAYASHCSISKQWQIISVPSQSHSQCNTHCCSRVAAKTYHFSMRGGYSWYRGSCTRVDPNKTGRQGKRAWVKAVSIADPNCWWV